MRLIKYEGYNLTIEPELLTLAPFKKIWTRDKSKDKSKALQELGYIYFMYDIRSDYQIYIDEEKRIARHEITTNLEQIIVTAKYLLRNRAPIYMVHRPERLMEIINLLTKYNFNCTKNEKRGIKNGNTAYA